MRAWMKTHAALTLLFAAGCGASGSSPEAECARAVETLCARACECDEGDGCTFGDGEGTTLGTDDSTECLGLRALLCSPSTIDEVDWGLCADEAEVAACDADGEGSFVRPPASCDFF